MADLSAALAKAFDSQPPHVQAGVLAYRAALNERKDWLAAVIAAIDAAERAKVSGSA